MSCECKKIYQSIAEQFVLRGDVLDIEPYGEGHINLTLLVTTTEARYIMQKMNTRVFPNTKGLMRNITAVTAHLEKLGVETLHVVPTRTGASFLTAGDKYRVYDFIEGTVTYQSAPTLAVLENAGAAFGEFQNKLAGFDADTLCEIIPFFHDTPKRYGDYLIALEQDALGRAKECREEIDFFLERKDTLERVTRALASGAIPMRVTHNDTKLNNILMDAVTGKARAVIDLDTVMPGAMAYDFGDSIRFGASTAAEDEQDLSKVHFDLTLFEAYTRGYASAVKSSITQAETDLLAYGAYLMTAECGMRFLTDYLAGDTYFATKYPGHNLVRARTQIKLAGEIWDRLDELNTIVRRYMEE